MPNKYDIPEHGKLDKKSVEQMAESLERQSHWLRHLVNFVEVIIPNDSDQQLLKVRDEFFKKDLLIASGTMKTVAKAIKSKKL